MQDLRAAHEALAHELTRTRSQATLKTRNLRDENSRLKCDLAAMRERAVRYLIFLFDSSKVCLVSEGSNSIRSTCQQGIFKVVLFAL